MREHWGASQRAALPQRNQLSSKRSKSVSVRQHPETGSERPDSNATICRVVLDGVPTLLKIPVPRFVPRPGNTRSVGIIMQSIKTTP